VAALLVARSSAPQGFSSEPSGILQLPRAFFHRVDFVVFTRCPELLQCSVCLLGLGGSSGGGSAVLLGSRDVGGREVDLRLGEDQPFLLRRRGVSLSRWWSKYDCLQCNTGCLERRSSQAVLRGSRLRLEEAGSTILIVSWSTRRAFSCPHRALKAP